MRSAARTRDLSEKCAFTESCVGDWVQTGLVDPSTALLLLEDVVPPALALLAGTPLLSMAGCCSLILLGHLTVHGAAASVRAVLAWCALAAVMAVVAVTRMNNC